MGWSARETKYQFNVALSIEPQFENQSVYKFTRINGLQTPDQSNGRLVSLQIDHCVPMIDL